MWMGFCEKTRFEVPALVERVLDTCSTISKLTFVQLGLLFIHVGSARRCVNVHNTETHTSAYTTRLAARDKDNSYTLCV